MTPANQSLDGPRPHPFLNDSGLLDDQRKLDEQRKLFQQQKANFEEERKKFTEAAIRLGMEVSGIFVG